MADLFFIMLELLDTLGLVGDFLGRRACRDAICDGETMSGKSRGPGPQGAKGRMIHQSCA